MKKNAFDSTPRIRKTIPDIHKWRFTMLIVLLGLNLATVLAQTITGKVVDQQGEGIPGVSVLIKDSNQGTITDVDGAYALKVDDTDISLVFSFIGMKTQEIDAAGRTAIDVIMESENIGLEELIVVGYGVQKKESVTGSISSIQSDDVARTTASSISNALVGKVSGVTSRQKSGTPGSGTTLQIRNFGTPLFVIDGIMSDEGQFNNLDANDIASISILKDGAAAIYGVKAANGVVLVTTKSGKKSTEPVVSLDLYTGFQQWTQYPDMLSPYEWNYANYMKEVNSGTLGVSREYAEAELQKWKDGYYNSETGEDYRGYDWYDNFVNKAAPQNYVHASVSGGGEKNTYFFSVSHIDQDAVFKDYNFKRTNMQANYNAQLSERISVGMRINGRIETRLNPGLPGKDDYERIRASLFEVAPIYRPYANDNPLYLNAIPGRSGQNLAAMTIDNAGRYESNWRVIQTNWNVDYETPLKGLKAKALFSYYYADNKVENLEKGWKEYEYDRENDVYNVVFDKSAAGNTYLGKEFEGIQDLTGQFTLNFDRTFNDKHHVTSVGGFEFYERERKYHRVSQSPVENEFIPLLSTSENNSVAEAMNTMSTASFIFRGGYEYKQKYIVHIGGRYDGSWKFPKDNRWGFFPSISGAWRLSEESFFQSSTLSEVFSNIKFRASYGEMGDDNLGGFYPDYAFLSGYSYYRGNALISNDPFGASSPKNIVGSAPKGIPITGLSWVTTSITNVGVELGFLNNKLNLEVDAFKRYRDGIPAIPNDIQFPLESGLSVLPQNLNSDETVGIDGFVRWQDAVGSFKYNVGVNATLSRQKNVNRYGELFANSWDQYRNSKSDRWANVAANQIWMYETIGVFQTQEEIDNYPVIIDGNNNTNLVPGDLIFKDQNGDGIIDQYDERPLGYAAADWPWDSSQGNKNPLLALGINLGFEWKGIDFAADFAGGFMNTYVADWLVKWGVNRGSNGYAYNSLDVWHHEDILDPTSPWVAGKFPALRNGNASTRWWNDFYTKEVNYLRLKNLVVGYSLPNKWLDKTFVSKCRFYFHGTNLFNVFNSLKDYGFDPEISSVNGQDYPQHRTYVIGLNLNF